MKTKKKTTSGGLFGAFRSAPGAVLRFLFLLVILWGVLLGLWVLGLIGEKGRDTIEPQRTVRLRQSGVNVLQTFLDDREKHIEEVVVESYVDPFR